LDFEVKSKINQNLDQYNSVLYVDSENGLDVNNGTESNPYKTIQTALNNANNGDVLILKGSFEGAVDNDGFVNIGKSIDIIGKDLPLIKSTDHNTIQLSASDLNVNIYNCRIENYGDTGTNYDDSYALMINCESVDNIKLNFYNCVIKPRGRQFISIRTGANNVIFNNCILDYNEYTFTGTYSIVESSIAKVLFNNCVEIGNFTSSVYKDKFDNENIIFKEDIYTGESREYITYQNCIIEPNISVDSNYNINQPEWLVDKDHMNDKFLVWEEMTNNIPTGVIDAYYNEDRGNVIAYCGSETYEYIDGNWELVIKDVDATPNLSSYNTVIYVDTNNGDDTNGDGSESNPYATLDKGINNISSDNVVKLNEGNYTYGIGSLSKNVTIIGEGLSTSVDVINKISGSGTINTYNMYIKQDGEGGISDIDNFYGYNCFFESLDHAPFRTLGNSIYVYIENCSIYTNYTGSTSGVNDSAFYGEEIIADVKNCAIFNPSFKGESAQTISVTTSLTGVTFDSDYNITSDG
jgi:hypothetical protein